MSCKTVKKKRLSDILHREYLFDTIYNESTEPVDIITEIMNTIKCCNCNTIKKRYRFKTKNKHRNKNKRNYIEQQIMIEKWNILFLEINK